MDISNDIVSASRKAIVKQKRVVLNDILKQASAALLSKQWEKAIQLYEKALNFISCDPYSNVYDLSELDTCTIEYSLYRCYGSNEKYFSKAVDEFIPLVITNGPKYPFLYYGLANLCLKQHSYRQAESIIINGLKAVANLKEKRCIKVNWPGTRIEMPESDPDLLLKALNSLKQQCHDMQQTVLQEYDGEVEYGNVCYQSDTSSDAENESKIPLVQQGVATTSLTTPNEPGISRLSSNEDLQASCSELLIPRRRWWHSPEIDQLDDDVVMNEMAPTPEPGDNEVDRKSEVISDSSETQPLKSQLKVDVPEFVPKSSIIDAINHSLKQKSAKATLSSEALPSTSDCNLPSPVQSLHRHCQTLPIKSVGKSVQARVNCVNAFTQTRTVKVEKDTAQHKDSNTEQVSTLKQLINKLNNDCQQQQTQIQTLHENLLAQKEKSMQVERQYLLNEQIANIEYTKLDVQVEGLQNIVQKVEVRNGDLENKVKMLQSLLTEHYSQYYARQKQLIAVHLSKCSTMIDNLKSTARYLSPTSVPTLEDCQRQICHWEDEFQGTRDHANLFNALCQKVFADLRNGCFVAFPEPPDLPTQLVELKDILHDSYVPVVQRMIREQQFFHQQNQHFQQQYSMWYNNYGRFQSNVAVHAGPYYYNQHNQPQGTSTPYSDHTNTFRNNTNAIAAPDFGRNAEPQKLEPSGVYLPSNSQHQEPQSQPEYQNVVNNVDNDAASQSSVNSSHSQGGDIVIQEVKDEPEPEDMLDNLSSSSVNEVQKESQSSMDSDQSSNGKTVSEFHHENKEQKDDWAAKSDASCGSDQTLTDTSKRQLREMPHEESLCDLTELQTNIKKLQADWVQTLECDESENSVSTSSNDKMEEVPAEGKLMQFGWIKKVNVIKPAAAATTLGSTQSTSSPENHSKYPVSSDSHPALNAKPWWTPKCPIKDGPADHPSQESGRYTNLNQLVKIQEPPDSGQPKSRSNFYNLVAYVTSNIPGATEEEVAHILKVVRKSCGKLTGQTRESLTAIVRAELSGEDPLNGAEHKPAWKELKSDVPNWNKDNCNSDSVCVICIEAYRSDPVTTLKCLHKFHNECIRQWFSTNSICPICRIHAVVDEDFPPLRT